jgi:EAL domain-containing protein (putative c-di-GMP-specific phosphodiesterase class I)
LKEFGIRLAVDDFGTGFANFQAISALRPDIIKIDRSFTAAATKDETDFVMLQDMRKLTQHLSMQMCVEGIETEGERDKMEKLGADCCQGFYFGHPCSQENFIKRFLQTKRPDTPIQWRGVPGKAAKEAI